MENLLGACTPQIKVAGTMDVNQRELAIAYRAEVHRLDYCINTIESPLS